MTQTTQTVSSPEVSLTLAAGRSLRVTDDAILAGVWSTAINCDDTSVYTATPGTGGSLIVQQYIGGVWSNVSPIPFTSAVRHGVSPGTTQIRATAIGVSGTLVVNTPLSSTVGADSVILSSGALTVSALVKTGPGKVYSIVQTSGAGKPTVRDSTSGSGGLTAGWGDGGASGLTLTANVPYAPGVPPTDFANGIYVEINGTATVIVFYQ